MLACSGAIAKHHRLGGLNHRNLFAHGPGGQQLEVRRPQFGVLEASPRLVVAHLPVSSHSPSSVCPCELTSSLQDSLLVGLGLTLPAPL